MTEQTARTPISTLSAVRYHVPLRQGGSLPAVVETDNDKLYVMKFLGAGQGAKALIAELVAGEIARALDLRIPEIVFITLDPNLPLSEPDPEIQDLLKASIGLNFGIGFLPEALEYNMLSTPKPDPYYASKIVWFDAYTLNIDRTPRNVNLLKWEDHLWLIDHGASLYFHHNWPGYENYIRSPFPMIRDHTLLPFANHLRQADDQVRNLLTDKQLRIIVDMIPDEWLSGDDYFSSHDDYRSAYFDFLRERRDHSGVFIQEAEHVRQAQL